MFDIPYGIDVKISWRSRRLAYSDQWKKRITVGPDFLFLSEAQQSAIIYHETAHIMARHATTRLKWLFSGKWRNLSAVARQHEFEADAFSAAMGYGDALIEVLKQHPAQCSILHPSTEDRIARLEAAK